MNIARFGVEIDPTHAESGSRRIVAAANRIGPALDDAADAAKDSGGAFSTLAKSVGLVIAPMVAALAAIMGLVGGLGFLKSAIDSAAEMEGFTNKWAFILGSFDDARDKMQELARYANTSPFDLPGVTQAALALSDLSDTGLDTARGLEMVGNAAGVADDKIENVATKLAKIINSLQRGGGATEFTNSLGEMGVFSSSMVAKLQDMGLEAKNFQFLLGEIKKELERAEGGTTLMSTSWKGKMSSMEDAWNSFKTAVGEPIMTALKPMLDDIMAGIDRMTAGVRSFGPEIQKVATLIPATFRTLQQDGAWQLALEAGWDALVQIMSKTWASTEKTLISVFKRAGWELLNVFNRLAQPSFWDGLVNGLTDAIGRAVDSAVPKIAAFDRWLKDEGKKTWTQRGKEAGDAYFKTGVDLIKSVTGVDMSGALKPPDAVNATITPEPDLPDPSEGGPPVNPLFDLGPAPDIVPFEVPEIEPTPAMNKWTDLFTKFFNSVNEDIKTTAEKNEKLVKDSKALRDKAAEDAKNAPHVETEEEKKEKLKAMIPGTDMNVEQGQAYAKRLVEGNRTPEEAYKAELEIITKLKDAKILSEESYREQVARTTAEYEAAQKKRTEASENATKKEQTAMQKLMAEWGNLSKQISEAGVAIMNSIADNITGAIVAMAEGTKSASEAFGDMAKGIMSSILQIITRLVVQYALMAAMGMAAGIKVPSFTSFAAGNLSGSGSNAAVMHSGGIVGESGASRSVPASTFAGAQRFHTGGVIGANEVPIIAERGEQVLTKDQQMDLKARLSGSGKEQGGAKITIVNAVSPDEIRSYITQNPDVILNVLSQNGPKIREIVRL